MTSSEFLITPPDYLSPSSIGTFQQCQLRFKFNRIDGMKEPPTRATLLGNFVHEVLESMYALGSQARTKDAARELATKVFTENDWAGQIIPYIGGESGILGFKRDAWRCIDNLWVIEDPIQTNPSGLEQLVDGEIAGVRIKGIIDRYSKSDSGEVVISDYKTGKTPSPKFADQKFFQLQIYAALIESTGLGTPKDLELLFLETGKKFTKSITPEVTETTAVTVRSVKNALDQACMTGVFAPNKGKLCDWCSFQSICPAWVN